MNEKQPEALRLAAILCNEFDTYTDTWSAKEAAGELRRLHEVNVELLEALVMLCAYTKSCEGLLNASPAGQVIMADTAIAKATKCQE